MSTALQLLKKNYSVHITASPSRLARLTVNPRLATSRSSFH